ncbi:larval cuticle protein 65Ag1-like [Homarus americanus]|uniref:larval cuticle protein 65Ag1-like n=1 Tax=Homarus americanus TaxID=6706 RepID=UPI001C449C1D|nr:larval cuticle protein 65Ag1-like [Homarus americanus]
MKLIVLTCVAAVALASPVYDQHSAETPKILVDERHIADDASYYNFQVETEDGITRQESGATIKEGSAEGAVAQSGSVSFTLPDGQQFEMTFVADENGFQPQSSFLPVAPEFPHEIPQFVLDQIEKARLEDEAGSREGPSSRYGAP